MAAVKKERSQLDQVRIHGNRVLVQLKAPDDMINSIVVPDVAKEDSDMGIVRKLGDQWSIEAVSVGDMVRMQKYGGTKISLDGVEYNLLNANDIFASFPG